MRGIPLKSVAAGDDACNFCQSMFVNARKDDAGMQDCLMENNITNVNLIIASKKRKRSAASKVHADLDTDFKLDAQVKSEMRQLKPLPAARLLLVPKKRGHITLTLASSHWSPVCFQILKFFHLLLNLFFF